MNKTNGNKSILIIESDASLRAVLQIALNLKGVTLYLTDSLQAAQQLIEKMSGKNPISAILFDLSHPLHTSETSLAHLQSSCEAKFGLKPSLLRPNPETPSLLDLYSLQGTVQELLA